MTRLMIISAVLACLAAAPVQNSRAAELDFYGIATHLHIDGSELDDHIIVEIGWVMQAMPKTDTRSGSLTRTTSTTSLFGSGMMTPVIVVRHYIMHERGSTELISKDTFAYNEVTRLTISAFGGDDIVENNTHLPSWIKGGNGDDEIWGGSGDDTLDGGGDFDPEPVAFPVLPFPEFADGWDVIYGGPGNDVLRSGFSNRDWLEGGAGDDELYGAPDWFSQLFPGTGVVLWGGKGKDTYYFHFWDQLFDEVGAPDGPVIFDDESGYVVQFD